MGRPLVNRSATKAEALRLEQFVADEGLEVEDLLSPPPEDRIAVSTNLSPKDSRRFEEFARRRGVTRSVILRALIKGRLDLEDRSG